MDRTGTVIKNTAWELVSYAVLILFGFLAPRFIILTYGSEVNGLSSTITQTLNILLLLQAGASTAAVYSLYKPAAEGDAEEVGRNIRSAELFFFRVSVLFAGLMLAAAALCAHFIDSGLGSGVIFTAFVTMGMKCLLDLCFTAKLAVVFTAFQEKFIVSIGTILEQTVYYSLVFLTIALRLHFLLLYLWLLCGGLLKVLFLTYVYRKRYADRITRYSGKDPGRIRGRTYSMAGEVAQSLVASSIAVLMSFMYSLRETSVYAVYALAAQALSLLTTAVWSAFAPGFGNLAASSDRKTAGRVFRIFQLLYLMLNTVLYMCMMLMILPFVRLYTAGAADASYGNRLLACLIVLNGLLSAYRIPYNVIVSSCGYFKETWLQQVLCVFVSIAVSCIGGRCSYALIVLGPVVFYLANFLYQHFRLGKLEPQLVSGKVFILLGISLAGYAAAVFAAFRIAVPEGAPAWCAAAILSLAGSCAYVVAAFYLLVPGETKEALRYVRKVFRRKRHS